MADDNGRISVSRDALRAELALMELRLVEKLATKAEVEEMNKKIAGLDDRVTALERNDLDRQAVAENDDALFSKREKRVGMVLAFVAILIQGLALTGVYH